MFKRVNKRKIENSALSKQITVSDNFLLNRKLQEEKIKAFTEQLEQLRFYMPNYVANSKAIINLQDKMAELVIEEILYKCRDFIFEQDGSSLVLYNDIVAAAQEIREKHFKK